MNDKNLRRYDYIERMKVRNYDPARVSYSTFPVPKNAGRTMGGSHGMMDAMPPAGGCWQGVKKHSH
jgi:hypothetical protein